MDKELDIALEGAVLQTADLQKELLVLRLAFGKLKAAVSDALAPLSAGFIHALSQGVFWAIRLVKNIGKVITALTGFRGAQKGVTKSVQTTAKALKRYVLGFDELNRVGQNTGGTVTATVNLDPQAYTISPELQAVADGIRAALQPLLEIDTTPVRWHLARLGESVTALWQVVKTGIGWIWQELLVPLAGWITEKLIPIALNALQGAVEFLTTALPPLGEGFAKILDSMQPVFAFIGQCLLTAIDQLRRLFGSLTDTFREKSQTISAIFENVAALIQGLVEKVYPLLDSLRMIFAATLQDIWNTAGKIIGYLLDAFHGLTEFLLGAFTGNWRRAWDGLKSILKGCVNGLIGLLNAMLTGLTGALNAVVKVANKLRFTMPDWVPGLGGKSFGLNLPTVKAPQIPYLAKGAVLPANKPFLAVVGDQTHGTNIEAPLSTIQQAVANVTEDWLKSSIAGQEATIGVLTQILQAVVGIELTDAAVGSAAARYANKMAVVKGV